MRNIIPKAIVTCGIGAAFPPMAYLSGQPGELWTAGFFAVVAMALALLAWCIPAFVARK